MTGRPMTKAISRLRTASLLALALAFMAAPPLMHPAAARAETAAGTVISNTATATFSEPNSSNSYAIQSNTVSVTVWDAPTVTVSNPASRTVAPSDYVITNSFVLTNTGNASGDFQLTQDAQFNDSNASLAGYILSGSSACAQTAAPCNLSALNSALDSGSYAATAPGGTVQIEVEYKVANSPNPVTDTIATTLTAAVTYPPVGAIPNSVTSASASGQENDSLKVDARLDLQKSATQPTASNPNIAWTIDASDDGSFPAHDTTTVQKFLGGSAPAGVLIVDKIPSYGTPLPVVSVNVPTYPSADTATVYYYNGSSWSTTFNASATYVAVLLSGAPNGNELAPNVSGSSNIAGNVGNPQVIINVVTGPPSGSGSADPNSVSNIANSVIGGNPDVLGDIPVIAPTINPGTYDLTNSSLTSVINNTTPSTGTTAPGGASNVASAQAYASWIVYNGPYGAPQATGNYAGSTPVDNMHDFTAYDFACTQTPALAGTCSNASAIAIPMTLLNASNRLEPFVNITTPTPPTGWNVTFYAATSCSTSGPGGFPVCTYGSTPITNFANVPSGQSENYVAVYTASGVPAFTAANFDITATGTGGAGTGTETNDTYDELYPGGPLTITKSVVVTSTNCPSGTNPAGPANGNATAVCPGGVLTYSLAYQNVASANLEAGGTGLGTSPNAEPAFATNALNPTNVLVTEDGAASNSSGTTYANNWTADTFGLNAAASDSGYASATSFTYYPANLSFASSGPYPNITAGYNKFTALLNGGSAVKPGTTGTITFNVTVK
jgi:hypothetical protein